MSRVADNGIKLFVIRLELNHKDLSCTCFIVMLQSIVLTSLVIIASTTCCQIPVNVTSLFTCASTTC